MDPVLETFIDTCENNRIDEMTFANEGFLSKIFKKKEPVVYENPAKAFSALVGMAGTNKVEILKGAETTKYLKTLLDEYNKNPGKVNKTISELKTMSGYPVIVTHPEKMVEGKPIRVSFSYQVKREGSEKALDDIFTAKVSKL